MINYSKLLWWKILNFTSIVHLIKQHFLFFWILTSCHNKITCFRNQLIFKIKLNRSENKKSIQKITNGLKSEFIVLCMVSFFFFSWNRIVWFCSPFEIGKSNQIDPFKCFEYVYFLCTVDNLYKISMLMCVLV